MLCKGILGKAISIHALREEGDQHPHRSRNSQHPFLSTPSARRATIIQDYVLEGKKFLSTPSARRATEGAKGFGEKSVISIHALREEGDPRRTSSAKLSE